LQQRNDAVALLLVDHRMPQMNGVEMLQEAIKLYPNAKRTLLTAYADTDAAIKAINDVQLNHYLLKPWDPPEEQLFPVLDDLLNDWYADFHPPFEGIRVLGTRWSSKSYDVRNFLARNQVPYQWLDADAANRDDEVERLLKSLAPEDLKLPVVLFPNGKCVAEPTTQDLAESLGLRTRAGLEFYDLAIVGGGPAGLAAAVYGASEGLKTIMVEREAPGGQAALSSRIENYLGFPSGLTGGDLTRRAVAQARRFGVEIVSPQEATALRVDGPYRYLRLNDGTELSCHAMLLATGVQWRKLDIPGMDRLQGAGVYYGGTSTEAIACRDEDVLIVGGANSAGQAAMFFSQYARRVVMLVRGDSLATTMSQYLIEQVQATQNIHIEYRTRVLEVHGADRLESVSIVCDLSGDLSRVPAKSMFVFIGAEPCTSWLAGVVERNERGFILTGPDLLKSGKRPKGWTLERDPSLLETNIPGVFAVGDVRYGSVKRVASGVGEGSVAIQFVHQYLSNVS
jgi:thioredoxin reductase (NADPH)